MRLKWLLIIGVILGGEVGWSGEIKYNFGGEYRYRQNWVSDFPTDERGRELGQEFYQESRLRANFQIQANSQLQVNLQADFFTGLLEGDEADLRLGYARWPWDSLEEDYQEFVFRQFWAEWTSKVGIFRLGQMSSHWGLGILANNGEGEGNLFGDTYFGDLAHRIMFASKPLLAFSQNKFAQNWVIAVAYDQVYLDENADYRAGDRAYQWIFFYLLSGIGADVCWGLCGVA